MTFWQWLRGQNRREDPVGDLSRDAIADKETRKCSDRVWWYFYLLDHHASSDAVAALERAWLEFEEARGY